MISRIEKAFSKAHLTLDFALEPAKKFVVAIAAAMALAPADQHWAERTAAEQLSATVAPLPSTFVSSDLEAVIILAFDYATWRVADPIPTSDLFLASFLRALEELELALQAVVSSVEPPLAVKFVVSLAEELSAVPMATEKQARLAPHTMDLK